MDNGTTWNDLGGFKMECVKYGTVNVISAGSSVSIAGLGISSTNQYFVIINGDGITINSSQLSGVYISDKTSSSFTLKCYNLAASPTVSYQVIKLY